MSASPRSAADAPVPVPTLPAIAAHVLKNDAEAIAIARDLAAKFAPEAAARDRDRRLPWAELDLFSQSGLWAMNVPAAFGGADVSYATVAEVFKIIASADASIAQIAQNHVSILDLVRFDPAVDRQRFFYAEALRGLRFGNATSERGGKHVRDFQTRIAETGPESANKGFVVNGEKFYATGALYAHLVPVTAVNDDGKTMLAFVAAGTQGLTIIDDWSGFGQRTTASGTVVLKDVFVPENHVLRTYIAFDTPSVHGPVAQIIQAAIDAGIAQGAIEETLHFVREKARPWTDSGQARASDDLFTIRDVGDLMMKLHAAEAVLARAGRSIDRGLRNETPDNVATASVAVAEAKVLTTEIAILATNKLFELSGTRSVLAVHNLDRHWRDARTHTLHDPVRWKFHAIGNYHLNGIAPPRHLWL